MERINLIDKWIDKIQDALTNNFVKQYDIQIYDPYDAELGTLFYLNTHRDHDGKYKYEDLLNSFSSKISNYRDSDDHYTLYTVDMSNAMNQSYAADVSNWAPTNAGELAINGPTLIHFKDGTVVEYYEGETDINNYLG